MKHLVILFTMSWILHGQVNAATGSPANIVFFLADDLGCGNRCCNRLRAGK